VGRSQLRTLYRDDVLVGLVDTPEIAAEIVAAMNRRFPEWRLCGDAAEIHGPHALDDGAVCPGVLS
jgi:hypothetical protein